MCSGSLIFFNHGITFYKVLLLINHINLQESVEIDREATKQLAWMENQLKLAKSQGQKAIIASHIPAG